MDTPRIAHRLPLGLNALRSLFAGFLAPQAGASNPPSTGTRTVDHVRIAYFEQPAGLTVTCEEGTLWLTFRGCTIDRVLQAGETHRCEAGDEGLVVSAAQPARFRMEAVGR